ncbi:hypothetical protein GCM10029992_11530 [Glycomyces albus]
MAVNGVGIRDVARLAGVSITTVSHVLNDTPNTRVSAETRARVREAAATLGYGPNRAARALRTNRSGLIGLLSEEIATTPHAGRIILGAQDAARTHDLTLVIVNAERESSGNSHEDDVQTLIDRQVEAVLYATMYHRRISVPANLRLVPAVLIDSTDRDGVVPAVVPDEVGGAVAAVTHLVEAGHRRIGFLNNDDDVPATHERLIGFRKVLHRHGIPVDERLMLRAPSETLPGYALAREVLAGHDRPTALFCYNDRMAMGAYRAAAELGLEIPRDLSIVGFDDQELISANLFPGLTTVALPHYEMGEWAVQTLVNLLSGDTEHKLPDGPTRLHCPLVTRGSVAAPKRTERSESMLRLAASWVWDFWIADDGDRYHLFFLKAPRALLDPDRRHWRATIGHATSTDLTTWTEHADAVIPDDSPAFDDLATWTGSVVRGDDGMWRMFYTAVSRAEDGLEQRISSVVSEDLFTWRRESDRQVLEPDTRWYETAATRQWPDQAWRDPWVFRDQDGWHMLITARANRGASDDRGVIGHATSPDLLDWTVQPRCPSRAPDSGTSR